MLFSVGQHTIIAVLRCCPTRLWDNISINRLTVRLSQHKKSESLEYRHSYGYAISGHNYGNGTTAKIGLFSSCPTVFGFVAADSSPSARASPVFFVFTAPFDAASESGAPGTASSPATVAAPSLSECAFAADDSAGAAATSAAPYTGTAGAGATEDQGTKSQGMRWANTAKRNRMTKP